MPYSELPKNTPKSGKTAPHQVTEENYELLEGMAMNGATNMQMADALGMCKDTLNKYYGDYLKSVKPLFDARVARQLKRNIFHEDPKIALDATKFYLNSKVGYKQEVKQETTHGFDEKTAESIANLDIDSLINLGKGLKQAGGD
jgi:hypothetical protein